MTRFSARTAKRSCLSVIVALAMIVGLFENAWAELVIVYSEKNAETCRFDAELAITPAEQAKGLMFRKTMEEYHAMFFVFDRDEIRHFWMRNTLIPLDMIFVDGSFFVVDVHRGAKPLDEKIISSRKPARYVLEVNAGKATKCHIKPGSKVEIAKHPR